MSEVVVVQIGQCGNRIGTKFWQTIAKEHGVNTTTGAFQGDSDLRSENIGAYFEQSPDNHFRPRAILVDLDPRTTDTVRAGPLGRLFNEDNFVSGNGSAQKNNYAYAYYDSECRELADYYQETIRNEMEKCDRLHGVQYIHSVSGGAGSGLASRIFERMRGIYCRAAQSWAVLPSPTASNSVVEHYNTVLTLQKIVTHVDMCVVVDNDALSSICERSLQLEHPSIGDMNQLVANALAGISSSYRFRGRPTMGMAKQAMNLKCDGRSPFCMASLSPLSSGFEQHRHLTTPEVTKKMFDQNNFLCTVNLNSGKFMTGVAHYKGFTTEMEINGLLSKYKADHSQQFSPYFDNIVASFVESPSKQGLVSATLLCQSSAIRDILQRQMSCVKALSGKQIYGTQEEGNQKYKRGAFFHKLEAYGMDHSQLQNAYQAINDAIWGCQGYENLPNQTEQVNDEDNDS